MSLTAMKKVFESARDAVYPHGVAFHHVPKCGGSSLSRAFRLKFLPSQVKIDEAAAYQGAAKIANCIDAAVSSYRSYPRIEIAVHALKRAMFAYHLASNVKFVQAHVHFDRNIFEAYRHTHAFITLLRHPINRYVSQYYYDYQRPNKNCITEDLDVFVDTPRGIETGEVFLDYFGEPHVPKLSLEQRVDRAKENIALLHLVGFLDEIDMFQQNVSDRIGVKIRLGHVNEGKRVRRPIDDKLLRRIADRCAADQAIYEHAKRLTADVTKVPLAETLV